jgi:hypothetical protein
MSSLPDTIATKIVSGDLSALDEGARVLWYTQVCNSLGLNPATRPFQFISLSDRLTLYCTRDGTDQLRRRDSISTRVVERRFDPDADIYSVIAQASTPAGRMEESIGAVAVGGLRGEARANAIMKAETKAKRRATLSICGLGFLDESEVADIGDAGSAPRLDVVARAAYDAVATEADGWSGFARNLLADSIEELTEGQREWLRAWCKDHPGPDGYPWPNVHDRRAFTIDHGPILAEWIAMAKEHSPPCEEDSEKAPKEAPKEAPGE